jgi:hypothetical protein
MEISKQRPKHRLLESFDKGSHYIPYQYTTQSQTGQQANQGTSQQQNTFTPGQTALQGQLGGLYSALLGGNIPSSFTNPAAATTAYNSNFNTQVAPGLASQYGAGSPVIGSQNALGLAQLQGNLYNTGVQNYTNALTAGSNYGLGMPTGAQGATTGNAQSASQGTSNTDINSLALLASILYS